MQICDVIHQSPNPSQGAPPLEIPGARPSNNVTRPRKSEGRILRVVRQESSQGAPPLEIPGARPCNVTRPRKSERRILRVVRQESNACLLFDASQRANWYISNRMWHSDPSRLHRMLELFVALNMRNLIPAILLQGLYDFSAGHKIRYTLFTHLSSRGLQERDRSRQALSLLRSGCRSPKLQPRTKTERLLVE
jgi:predicted RNA-binding protein YlxR (DUF448 family)